MKNRRRSALAASLVALVALATACSSSGSKTSKDGKVTLTWWHNATADPGKTQWQKIADAYHSAHPKVTIKVEPIQNEQFTTKVPVALQGDNPPDIYQQWGGGALATQVQSGKLMDLTQLTSGWIDELGPGVKGWQADGKQYGVPFDYHIVGFWYRKDLFAQAGVTSTPTTMPEFNAAVGKLKAAGIAPIAIGSKDRWPDAFYWDYFVLRECPKATVVDSLAKKSLDDPCFTKAGEDLKALLDTKPFQKAFLGTPAQQGAGSSAGLVANGKAAMELQGDWEMAVMPSLATDKNFASKLGWFPFPSVPGAGGDQQAALGGGDGFSCTKSAGAACADFLKYVSSAPVQRELVQAKAATLPANPEANDAITDPTLKTVLSYLQQVQYNQLYFDQALPTNAGQALNDAVANFFAGKGSPKAIADSVKQAGG